MFKCLLTFTGANNIDNGVTYLHEEVLPVLSAQRGYRGVLASAARSEGVFWVLSLWDLTHRRKRPKHVHRCGWSGLPLSIRGRCALADNEVCGQFHTTGQRPPAVGAFQ